MTNQDPLYISAQDMFVECVEGDRDSWGSLMRVLRSGELEQPGDFVAYGTKKGKSLAEAIHTDYWINGDIRFEATGGNLTSFAEPKTLGADFDACSFQDIKFRRSDIDKWKAWRVSIHQPLPSSYKMDEGYINVAQACFFMATSKWWSTQEISNREETHSKYAQFKEYLDAVCSGEPWPPTGIHADNVWLSCVNGCLEHLKLEMTARNLSEHSFRDHIIDWQQGYATLNEQLEHCADKIRQAGRIEQLNLIGQPTNFGGFQSSANLRRITANELGTESVVLQWLSNDLRFKGKAWRDRKEPDFINVQMLRSKVEQLWPSVALEDKSTSLHSITPSKAIPTNDDIRNAARFVYDAAPSGKKPNIADAEKLIREKIAEQGFAPASHRGKNNPIRSILEEPEFANQRNRQGRKRTP